MYYVMRASAPSLHRESTDSLIIHLYSRYKCKLVANYISIKSHPYIFFFFFFLYKILCFMQWIYNRIIETFFV